MELWVNAVPSGRTNHFPASGDLTAKITSVVAVIAPSGHCGCDLRGARCFLGESTLPTDKVTPRNPYWTS